MSRLTIDITEQQHQSLKVMAALQGKTIKQYAIERLFPATAEEDAAWQDLKTLLGERIAAGLAGEVSSKGVDAIVDEELDEELGGDRRA
ncbi:MAG TPA: antitoxin [Sphingopyxis sp.]|nr:antitoxin [Sphingopyxis sp.]HMP45627.1 antitoxin [Sphingopyxis sp.]HMQ20161.1 antitoxin [Sphingopyxis sp.]